MDTAIAHKPHTFNFLDFSTYKHPVLVMVVISFLIGFCAVGVIYGCAILDITYTDWLIKGDMATYQISWEAYRDAPWMFPISNYISLSYPFTMSIAFSDALPLFAIPVKLFSLILPENFQYFGVWILLCHALNAYYAMRIFKRYTKNIIVLVMIGFIFTFASVLFNRFSLYGHLALGGQFLLLMGFDMLIADTYDGKAVLRWCVILALSIAVHAYITFMLLFLFAGYLLNSLLAKKGIKFVLIAAGLNAVACLLIVFLLGFFSSEGGSLENEGYGHYNASPISLINSLHTGRLPDLPMHERQSELAYLGLGMIALFVSMLFFLPRWWRESKRKRLLWGLVLPSAIAFVFALGDVVAIGDTVLLTIDWPESIMKFFSIVRANGRFIWLMYYLCYLFAIYMAIRYITKIKWKSVVLAGVLAVQLIDFSGHIPKRRMPADVVFEDVLQSEFWEERIDEGLEHLIFYPYSIYEDRENGQVFFHTFARFANRNDLTLNVIYFSRFNKDVFSKYAEDKFEQAKNGVLGTDELIIFGENQLVLMKEAATNENISVLEVDGYIVIVPKNEELESLYKWKIERIEYPEGLWLHGDDTFFLESEEYEKKGMKINMLIPAACYRAMGYEALSDVEIYINGDLKLSIPINDKMADFETEVFIPKDAFDSESDIYEIRIESQVFVPQMIGPSDDPRELGVMVYEMAPNDE